MRNKLVYFYSIKIHASGLNELLESIFCLLLVLEAFSLQKVLEVIERVVVSWQEIRWIWQMTQNFVAQFIQLLKHWLWDVWSGIVMENWAHPVDQYRLQALLFSVHLTDLPSILLRWNGFTKFQKAVIDQTGRRPPNSGWPWLFFGISLAFGSALDLLLV